MSSLHPVTHSPDRSMDGCMVGRKLVALASAQEDMRLMAEYAKKLEKEEQERKSEYQRSVRASSIRHRG